MKQEQRSKFPIEGSPASFEKFCHSFKDLYDDQACDALRAVQPWSNLPDLGNVSSDSDERYAESFRWSALGRLHRLWNIDKHRRVPLTAWWPGTVYVPNGPDGSRRRLTWADRSGSDGSVAFYIDGADASSGDEVSYGFSLAFAPDQALDDFPDLTHDVVREMDQLRWHVDEEVFWPVFEIMSR